MKRKKLTIILFSLMALAATTPRAVHHFHDLLASAQTRAQSELLQLLLSFSAPASDSAPAAADSEQFAICEKESPIRVEVEKARPASFNVAAPPTRSRKAATETAHRNESLRLKDAEALLVLGHLGEGLENDRRAFVRYAPLVALAAPYLEGKQVEQLNTMLRSTRLEERRTARAVQREMWTLSRLSAPKPGKKPAPQLRPRFDKSEAPAPHGEPQPEGSAEGDYSFSFDESLR